MTKNTKRSSPLEKFVVIDLVLFKETELLEESRAYILSPQGRRLYEIEDTGPRKVLKLALSQIPGSSPNEFMVVTSGCFNGLVDFAVPIKLWEEICGRVGNNPEKHDITKPHPNAAYYNKREPKSPPILPRQPKINPPRLKEKNKMMQISLDLGYEPPPESRTVRKERLPLPGFYLVNSGLHTALVDERRHQLTSALQKWRTHEGEFIPQATLRSKRTNEWLEVFAASAKEALAKARLQRLIPRYSLSWVAVTKDEWQTMCDSLLVKWPAIDSAALARPRQLQLIG